MESDGGDVLIEKRKDPVVKLCRYIAGANADSVRHCMRRPEDAEGLVKGWLLQLGDFNMLHASEITTIVSPHLQDVLVEKESKMIGSITATRIQREIGWLIRPLIGGAPQ